MAMPMNNLNQGGYPPPQGVFPPGQSGYGGYPQPNAPPIDQQPYGSGPGYPPPMVSKVKSSI